MLLIVMHFIQYPHGVNVTSVPKQPCRNVHTWHLHVLIGTYVHYKTCPLLAVSHRSSWWRLRGEGPTFPTKTIEDG